MTLSMCALFSLLSLIHIWYGMFYDMAAEVRAQNRVDDVYTLCGVDDSGKVMAVVTYYTDDDCAPDKTVRLDFGRDASYSLLRLDERHDGEKCGVTDDLTLTLPRQSCEMCIRDSSRRGGDSRNRNAGAQAGRGAFEGAVRRHMRQ